MHADTVITVARNNEFSIKGQSEELHDATVILGGLKARKSFSLFIEKGVINVKGNRDSLDYVTITGTPGNEEYTAYKKTEDDIYSRIRSLQAQLKEVKEEGEKAKIYGQMDSWRDSIRAGRIHFISTKPGSPSSAIYLYVLQDHGHCGTIGKFIY